LLAVIAVLLLAGAVPILLAVLQERPQAAPSPEQVVQNAWQSATQAEGFSFVSQVAQTTFPAPLVTNAGRTSHTDALRIEGQVDRPQDRLRMVLWNGAAVANPVAGQTNPSDGFEILVENGQAKGRLTGGEWQSLQDLNVAFTPASDALIFVKAARNVRLTDEALAGLTAGEDARQLISTEAGATPLHYAFDINGPALALAVRDQMESALAANGSLPSGVTLSTSDLYHGAQGEGELWVLAGQPARLNAHIEFPRQKNGERVEMDLVTTFSNFRQAPKPLAAISTPWLAGLVTPLWEGLSPVLPDSAGAWRQAWANLSALLLTLALLLLLLTYRHKPWVYATCVGVIIFSMTVTPLLQAQQVRAGQERLEQFNTLLARPLQTGFAQPKTPAYSYTDTSWNPHQPAPQIETRLPAAPQTGQPIPAFESRVDYPVAQPAGPTAADLALAAINATTGPAADSDLDGDGLYYIEEQRVGTDPDSLDTDNDLLPDGAEAKGFWYNGQMWYTNPLDADTNRDGRPDGAECPERIANPVGICRDTNNDGTPDAFTADDDGDGVLDAQDLAPLSWVGAQDAPGGALTADQPLLFNLSGLKKKPDGSAYPVLVDFQLRPSRPQRLWSAFNVYDWPKDTQGQIQRSDDKTFASYLTAAEKVNDPYSQNGDLRLTPMVEIEMGGSELPLPLASPAATEKFDNRDITGTIPTSGLLSGTVNITPSGTGSLLKFTFHDTSEYKIILQQGACHETLKTLSTFTKIKSNGTANATLSVNKLADGKHSLAISSGKKSLCVLLHDIPNGPYADKMVDSTALQPYGISVRDNGADNKVSAYLPVNVVTDPVTGDRVALNTRALYSSRPEGWTQSQMVRLIWVVQVLADGGGTSIAHTYYDSWYLTGVQASEDHGLNVGVVFQDPKNGTPASDDKLVLLARGLDKNFLQGRDQNTDGQRDITLDEIKRRFDNTANGGTSDTERWGLPQNVFRVLTFSYPSQDHMSKIMSVETPNILKTYFTQDSKAKVDAPVLLFAQEQRSRSLGLDERDQVRLSGRSLTLDLNEQQVPETLQGVLTLSAYRYTSEKNWTTYPVNEFMDRLEVGLKKLSLYNDADPARRQARLLAGKSVYLALMQGVSGVMSTGGALASSDDSDNDSATLTWIKTGLEAGLGGGTKDVVKTVTDEMSDATEGLGKLNKLGKTGKSSKTSKLGMAGALALTGVSTGLQFATTALGEGTAAQVMESVTSSMDAMKNVVDVVDAVRKFSKTSKALKSGAGAASKLTAAEGAKAATKAAKSAKAAKIGAAIGLAISIGATWGTLGATLALSNLTYLQRNAAIAEAVAETIVAVMLVAISFIPIVGQIIAAVIGLIDGLATAICAIASSASGTDVEKTAAGKRLCGGLTGLLTAIVKMMIYGQRPLISNLGSSKRLDMDFDQKPGGAFRGFTNGNFVRYTLALTNTVKGAGFVRTGEELDNYADEAYLPLPFDPLAIPYMWQFNETNHRKTVFIYDIQDNQKGKVAIGDLGSMSSKWKMGDNSGAFMGFLAGKSNYYTTYQKTLEVPMPPTGINQPLTRDIILVEGRNIPTQECFVVSIMPPIPVCHIVEDKATIHIPLAEKVVFDVLPEYLDGFLALTGKDGGFTLNWSEPRTSTVGGKSVTVPGFARQKDADGDGLLNKADGGNDPDDGQADSDHDGVPDARELQVGTDPLRSDSDGDGLIDSDELRIGTDPLLSDSEGDGLSDKEEMDGWTVIFSRRMDGSVYGMHVSSDPLEKNADGDVWDDDMEKAIGFSPWAANDANLLAFDAQVREAYAPRGLWLMEDDRDATSLADASGDNNAAVCSGSACPQMAVSGRYGRGALFDGSDDAARVENLAPVNNNFTLAAWVKKTTPSMNKIIMEYGNDRLALGTLFLTPAGEVGCKINSTVASTTWSGAGPWTHWACTFNGGTLSLYQDGVNMTNASVPSFNVRPTILSIGARLDGYYSFEGMLDEVALYDRAVNADEINLLMSGRYNPNDFIVAPGNTFAYKANLGNQLTSKNAEGQLALQFDRTVLAREAVRLKPIEFKTLSGEASVPLDAPSGQVTMTLGASVNFVEQRAQSNNAEVWLKFDDLVDKQRFGMNTFDESSGNLPPRRVYCTDPSWCPLANQPGRIGGSAYFNGSRGHLLIDEPNLDLTSFTVAAWVKRERVFQAEPILMQGYYNTTHGALEFGVGKDDLVFCRVNDRQVTSPGTIRMNIPGTWAHWACSYSNYTTNLSLYYNGQKVASQDIARAYQPSGREIAIGGMNRGDAPYFKGWLDDLVIYNGQLSDADVRGLGQQPSAYFNFDQRGPRYTDSVNPSADTQRYHRCLTGDREADLTWPYGISRSGLRFQGGQWCELTPGGSGIPPISFKEYTLSFWIKPDVAWDGAEHVLTAGPSGLCTERYLGLSQQDNNLNLYLSPNNNCQAVTIPKILSLGAWQNIAVTVDKNRELRAYVGGNLVKVWQLNNDGQELKLGTEIGHDPIGLASHYKGYLDEWRVYSQVLDGKEVGPALVGALGRIYLPLDDLPGTSLFSNRYIPRQPAVPYNVYGGSAPYWLWPQAGLDGVVGGAVSFDGREQVLDAGPVNLDEGVDFTMSAWVRRELSNRTQYILRGGPGMNRAPSMGFTDRNHFFCGYGTEWGMIEVNTDYNDANQWVHWACQFKKDWTTYKSTMTIYRNAQVVRTQTDYSTFQGSGNDHLFIGLPLNGAAGFKGALDEVRVVAYPVSGAEAGFSVAPRFSMKFEEAQKARSFSNSITGAAAGVCYNDACPVSDFKGKVNRAVRFDGENDTIGLGPALEPLANGLSVALWTKREDEKGTRIALSLGDNLQMGYRSGRFFCTYGWVTFEAPQLYADQDKWTHWVCTVDGRTLALFRNGVPQGNPLWSTYPPPQGAVRLGASARDDQYFFGALDEVQVYDRRLYEDEVKLMYERQNLSAAERSDYSVTVDADTPTARLNSPLGYYPNQNVLMQISASNPASRVTLAELGLSGPGGTAWNAAEACLDGQGGAAWCPWFTPTGGEGRYTLQGRVTNAVGRQSLVAFGDILVDGTPPQASSDIATDVLVTPTLQQDGWTIDLAGSLSDPGLAGGLTGSGVLATSVRVSVLTAEGKDIGQGARQATLNGTRWSTVYNLGSENPTGQYTLHLEAQDNVGNSLATNLASFRIDATGPQASLTIDWPDVITSTTTLSGTASELPSPTNAALYLPFEEDSGATWFKSENESNLAAQQAASQSSTAQGRPAGRAVDGLTDSRLNDTIAQTEEENQPWWQVDLGGTNPLTRLHLWGSAEHPLANLHISLSSDAGGASVVWSTDLNGMQPSSVIVPVATLTGAPVSARYVRIQRSDAGVLALAEVQVYGLLQRFGTCSGACPEAGAAGFAGRAASFAGSSLVSASRPLLLPAGKSSQSFSAAFWANRGAGSGEQVVLGHGASADGLNKNLVVGFRANNAFFCDFSGNALETRLSYAPDGWTHWACVYDNLFGLRSLYRNGILVEQDTITTTAGYAGQGNLVVGADSDAGRGYNGLLDEVLFYQRALPAAEVRGLAQPQVNGLLGTDLYFKSSLPASAFYTQTYNNSSGKPLLWLTFENDLQDVSGANQPVDEAPRSAAQSFSPQPTQKGKWVWDLDLGSVQDLQALEISQCPDLQTCYPNRVTALTLWIAEAPLPTDPTTLDPQSVYRQDLRPSDFPVYRLGLGGKARGRYVRLAAANSAKTLTGLKAEWGASPLRAAGAEGAWARRFQGALTNPLEAGPLDLGGGSFTLAAWAKRLAVGGEEMLVTQGGGLRFGFAAGGQFICSSGGSDLASPQAYTEAGVWEHWACVYDALTNTRRLYRDGLELARDYPGGAANSGLITLAPYGFTGDLDDVRLYPRPLSTGELASEFSLAPWQPTSQGSSGAGVTFTTWQGKAPSGLEGEYYLNLRGSDTNGAQAETSQAWRGIVDTSAPRVLDALRRNWRGSTYHIFRVQDYYLSENKYQMDVTCRVTPQHNGLYLDQRAFFETPWFKDFTDQGTARLVEATVYCPEKGFNRPPATLTACDLFGNCTQARSERLESPAEGSLATEFGVFPAFTQQPQPVTIPITAATSIASMKAITLSVNTVPLTATTLAEGAAMETTWSPVFTPTQDGIYTLTVQLSNYANVVLTDTMPGVLLVDSITPQATLVSTQLTSTHLTSAKTLPVSGVFTENIGLASLVVQIGKEAVLTDTAVVNRSGIPAALAPWTVWWKPPSTSLDNVTYPVTVTAADWAERVYTSTSFLNVDLQTPAPVSMTVSHAGAALALNTTVTATHPTLALDWSASSDGSGLQPYRLGWIANSVLSALEAYDANGARLAQYQPPEAAQLFAELHTTDTPGNTITQTLGPFYADAPGTPDYIALETGSLDIYADWMKNGCTLVGADNHARDMGEPGLAQNLEQKLYLTWDSAALRLAWEGADWNTDGDLFIYLNTRDGGTTRAYNPYLNTQGSVAVVLPFDADFALWVLDSQHAQLLAWNTTSLQWDVVEGGLAFGTLAAAHQTHLRVDFSALGISDPTTNSLGLAALATEEGSLYTWASLPARNPVNSTRLLGMPAHGRTQILALTQAFFWNNLGAGICPNQALLVDPTKPPCATQELRNRYASGVTAIQDAAPLANVASASLADVRARLTPDPAGNAYSILGDNLFSLMQGLPQFAGAADWSGLQAELCAANPDAPECTRTASTSGTNIVQGAAPLAKRYVASVMPGAGSAIQGRGAWLQSALAHTLPQPSNGLQAVSGAASTSAQDGAYPPVGNGQPVTYTLKLTNKGEAAAAGVVVDVLTFGPLRLPAGTPYSDANGEYYHLVVNGGDLPAGETSEVVIAGLIDYSFDAGNLGAGVASLNIVVYDNTGSFDHNQIDWVFVDYTLDQSGPITVLHQETPLVRAGDNTLHGLSFDQSAVPAITLQVRAPSGITGEQTCQNANPADSAWACPWTAAGASGGQVVGVRARATDRYGQTGAWSPWLEFTVDDTPPTLALDPAFSALVNDGVINAAQATWSGTLADDYLAQAVQVCTPEDGACSPAALLLDPASVPTQTYTYNDQPAAPIAIGASTACNSGGELVRAFQVTEDFPVGSVKVGLDISHTYRADLSAWLQAPSGTWVTLLWNGTAAHNYNLLLADSASATNASDVIDHDTAQPEYPNLRRPDGALGLFTGERSAGAWTLMVCDYTPEQDDGAYLHSRLILQTGEAPANTQGAWSYALPVPEEADGLPQSYDLVGLDSVGNITTTHLAFHLDNVAPLITVTTAVASGMTGAAALYDAEAILSTPTLAGVVRDGSGVESVLVMITTPSGQEQTEHAVLQGADWAYQLAPSETGVYSLTVGAVDRAGNLSLLQTFPVTAKTQWQSYLPWVPASYKADHRDTRQYFFPWIPNAAAARQRKSPGWNR
jgi:subtilisin-like proprotein convertase family protein